VAHSSSPARGAIATAPQRSPERTVARRLDFSKSSQLRQPVANGPSKTSAAKGRKEKLTNGHSQPTHHDEPTLRVDHVQHEEEEEEEDIDPMELLELAVVEQEEPEQEDQEQEDELPIIPEFKAASKSKPPGRRGRKPKAIIEEEHEDQAGAAVLKAPIEENDEDDEPVKKRRGRPKAAASDEKEEESTPVPDPTPPKPSKRGRAARNSAENVEENADEPRDAKRQKIAGRPKKMEQNASSKSVVDREKGKPGRKRKSSGIGVDSPKIQRGPPLPRSRGLVTIRREEVTAMKTTRSGRTSFKPLEWWKGEHVEYDEEEGRLFTDSGNRHFKMPTVKGIVRTEEVPSEPTNKRRGRPATGRKPRRRRSAIPEEEEVERDEWEYEPGRLEGDVVIWRPEHEMDPPEDEDEVEVDRVDLAISENAIQLRDIKDATFKFAKTLTLPFFGSGIVELPPGAQKKTKNSRKMHLAFFVHSGNVQAIVGQTEFGIAKGGMFFVPRGLFIVLFLLISVQVLTGRG
jgi:centromere protein C